MSWLYLILNLFTVSYPAWAARDRRINFHKYPLALMAGLLFPALFFLIWDHYFTMSGVWSFNKEYLIGFNILALPLEEWMFFIVVPFACLFIYEVAGYYFPLTGSRWSTWLSICILVLLFIIAVIHYREIYTFMVCLAAMTILIVALVWQRRILPVFFLSYLIHLIPFFLVNGILTAMPVVEYNDPETMGIRVGTIPAEDLIYSFSLFLFNVFIYETAKPLENRLMKFQPENP